MTLHVIRMSYFGTNNITLHHPPPQITRARAYCSSLYRIAQYSVQEHISINEPGQEL